MSRISRATVKGPTLEDLFANGRRIWGDQGFEEAQAAGRGLSLPDGIKLADHVLRELAGAPPGV